MKNMSLSPANVRMPRPDSSYRVPRKSKSKYTVRNVLYVRIKLSYITPFPVLPLICVAPSTMSMKGGHSC